MSNKRKENSKSSDSFMCKYFLHLIKLGNLGTIFNRNLFALNIRGKFNSDKQRLKKANIIPKTRHVCEKEFPKLKSAPFFFQTRGVRKNLETFIEGNIIAEFTILMRPSAQSEISN